MRNKSIIEVLQNIRDTANSAIAEREHKTIYLVCDENNRPVAAFDNDYDAVKLAATAAPEWGHIVELTLNKIPADAYTSHPARRRAEVK